MQETALLSTAIPHRPSLGLMVASAVVGHLAVVPMPKRASCSFKMFQCITLMGGHEGVV